MGLTSDVSDGNWHITGLVKKYAGFGLYLTSRRTCPYYGGPPFDIQGTFTGNGVGDGGVPAASVTMTVGDAPTEVDSRPQPDAAHLGHLRRRRPATSTTAPAPRRARRSR